MKKIFLSMALVLAGLSAQAQGPNPNSANNLPMVKPEHVWLMPSDAELAEWKSLNEQASIEDADLPQNMWDRYEKLGENPVLEELYSGKCSWYCGGEVQRVTASSHLKSQGKFNYLPKNAHDFDHESAWVEGAQGQGIGEWIEYEFAGACPRVTGVKILAGYVKSKTAYESNSRPKYIKVYYLRSLDLSAITIPRNPHGVCASRLSMSIPARSIRTLPSLSWSLTASTCIDALWTLRKHP